MTTPRKMRVRSLLIDSGDGTYTELVESDVTGLQALLGGGSSVDGTFNNLTVNGILTVADGGEVRTGETVLIKDNLVVLNSNATGTPTVDGGIELERGDSTNAQLIWNETLDRWEAGLAGSLAAIRTGTVAAADGGTGLTSYTAGDLIYASDTTALAKLAATATGNVLLSGTSPSWGKVTDSQVTATAGDPLRDAIAKRHSQNTDTETTATSFRVGSTTNLLSAGVNLIFGDATAPITVNAFDGVLSTSAALEVGSVSAASVVGTSGVFGTQTISKNGTAFEALLLVENTNAAAGSRGVMRIKGTDGGMIEFYRGASRKFAWYQQTSHIALYSDAMGGDVIQVADSSSPNVTINPGTVGTFAVAPSGSTKLSVNSTGVGFFELTPAPQQSVATVALSVSATYDQTEMQAMADVVDQIRSALYTFGLCVGV